MCVSIFPVCISACVMFTCDQACAWTPTRAQTAIRGSIGSVGSVDNDSASYLPISLRPNPVAPCSAYYFMVYAL